VAEHRIRNIRDELKEGDQILVKVLSIEGNKIRLSRRAVLREQREKQRAQAQSGSSGAEGTPAPAPVRNTPPPRR
jgi:polyribonucleotide nucleotidyltransferase